MKSNQIYAEKCDFETSIFHPDKQFLEIQDVIRQKFESIYFEDEFGEQQGFISALVNLRLKIIPDSKVYLVNLKEKEGSYFLEFALIIITGISNYGGFREGFDYLKDDISHIFKQKLGDEYTVNVSYEITEITEKSKEDALNFPKVHSAQPAETPKRQYSIFPSQIIWWFFKIILILAALLYLLFELNSFALWLNMNS